MKLRLADSFLKSLTGSKFEQCPAMSFIILLNDI